MKRVGEVSRPVIAGLAAMVVIPLWASLVASIAWISTATRISTSASKIIAVPGIVIVVVVVISRMIISSISISITIVAGDGAIRSFASWERCHQVWLPLG